MTWGKAFLPVCAAGIFDFLGFIFALFGIFGPLLAGVWAGAETGSTVVGGGVALAAGFFGGAEFQMFGVIMAMVIGFFGWLVVGLILLVRNRRIFKGANSLMFGSVLLIDEIPFVNVLPALSYRTIRMYRAQIQEDKKALAEYEATQKQQQIAEARKQAEQRTQQQAMNDEADEVAIAAQEQQEQAEDETIHEEEKLAA
jgi:hypothetical protein